MSIPEAPFDGEAHARKEGAWVVAYGKTALGTAAEQLSPVTVGRWRLTIGMVLTSLNRWWTV